MIRKIFLYLILSALTALAGVGGVLLWMGPSAATDSRVILYLAVLVLAAAFFMRVKGKFFKNYREIISYAVLTVLLAFIFQAVIFWNTALCGNCGPDEIFPSQSDIGNYSESDYYGFELTFSSNTGPIPPAYYREEVYVVHEKNIGGEIIAEHTISDYNKVLEKTVLPVTRDQFSLFISQAMRVKPAGYLDSLSGCTGGSTNSLEVLKDGKVILKTSSYSCAGKSSNESLERFSSEFYDILNRIME